MMNPQDLREIQVFKSFSQNCMEGKVIGIEKRDPPEPDIRCEIRDRGSVAFELVEIVDEQHVARGQGIQLDVMDNFRKKLKEMAQVDQDRLTNRMGDATVRVRMNQEVSTARRRAAIVPILRELLSIDPLFEGEYVLPGDLRELASLTVVRGNFDGPRFTAMHATHYDPVPTTGINRKLNQAYQSDAPIELLAYFDTQHAPLPEAMCGLRTFVESGIAASVFERVWIYDLRNERMVEVIEQGSSSALFCSRPF